MKFTTSVCVGVAAVAAIFALPVSAQTVKIGLISTYSGPGAAQGDQIDKGVKLYMKLNADKLPPGVKVELITRDDTGPNPDVAKRIAQELIVRDKVNFLTGIVWTPNMAAIGPLIGGWVRDVAGNFHGLLLTHAIISAVLLTGALLLRPPAKQGAAAAPALQDAAT